MDINNLAHISILLAVLCVLFVIHLLVTRYPLYSENVKDVKNTMSEAQKQKTSDSAPDVEQRYLLDLAGLNETEVINKKCSKCNVVTPHEWCKMGVLQATGEVDPMDLLKKAKRIILCQNCGHMSVTN